MIGRGDWGGRLVRRARGPRTRWWENVLHYSEAEPVGSGSTDEDWVFVGRSVKQRPYNSDECAD